MFADEFKGQQAANSDVCEILNKTEGLKPVLFDKNANRACRENNKKVVQIEEDEPTLGGNADAYKAILQVDGDDAVKCVEFTTFKYSQSPCLLIAFQILKHHIEFKADLKQKEKEAKKEKKDSKEEKKDDKVEVPPHPILSADLSVVGMSQQSHKKVENLIQILYVMGAQSANGMN